MKFSPKLRKELLDLMTEVQDEFLLEKEGTKSFIFDAFPDDDVIEYDYIRGVVLGNKRKILLEKIAELGALKIKHTPRNPNSKNADFRYTVELNKERFPKLYEELGKDNASNSTDHKGTIFHLDSDGNFWLEPKDELCYSMGAKSDRLKILAYLVDNKGYQDTLSIANSLESKDGQGVRKEIGKIRVNITKNLKIDGNEIIESKKDSGYRINPAYKIIKT